MDNKYCIGLLIVLILGMLFLGFQYYTTKAKVTMLTNDIKNLQSKLANLSQKNRELSEKLANYQVEVSTLESQLDYLRNKINNQQTISDIYTNVSRWMRDNFYYNFSNENFIRTIVSTCVQNDVINLPCTLYILRKDYGFHYENDTVDLIKPVSQFIKDKGGDCEDWALFVASLTNYLTNRFKDYKLSLYIPKNGSKYVLFIKNNKEIYYANCGKRILNISGYYPSILCYQEKDVGHCVVGFSREFLTPKNFRTEEVYLIETQTGQYLGTLSEYPYKNSIFIIANPDGLYIHHWEWWI